MDTKPVSSNFETENLKYYYLYNRSSFFSIPCRFWTRTTSWTVGHGVYSGRLHHSVTTVVFGSLLEQLVLWDRRQKKRQLTNQVYTLFIVNHLVTMNWQKNLRFLLFCFQISQTLGCDHRRCFDHTRPYLIAGFSLKLYSNSCNDFITRIKEGAGGWGEGFTGPPPSGGRSNFGTLLMKIYTTWMPPLMTFLFPISLYGM